MSRIIGLIIAVCVLLILWIVLKSESSTDAIAVVLLPFYALVAILVVLAVGFLFRVLRDFFGDDRRV